MDNYLGRWDKGDRLPITVVTGDAAGTPTAPDDAPVVIVYGDSGAVVAQRVPIHKASGTGVFRGWLDLTSSFASGRYTLKATWSLSGAPYEDTQQFEVTALGGSDGTGIAAAALDLAPNRYLVAQGDLGTVKAFRNPKLP